MAQGSIRIRCSVCRKAGTDPAQCKHKERVFNALYPTPAGKQDTGTFKTKAQADLFLAEKRLFYHKNPQYLKPKPITFGEVADQYLEEKKNSPLVSAKAWSNYDSIIRIHLKPKLGDKVISNITPQMAEDVRLSVQGMSKSVRQKVNMRLNAIFKRAMRENLIGDSPTKDLDRLTGSEEINYNILEPQQIRDFLNVPFNLFFKLYYELPIYCGLRASEVVGLAWDCVHFDTREIEVKKVVIWLSKKEMARTGSKTPWYFKPCPKTKAGFRKIPMNDELIKELQIFKIEQPENEFNLVFATKAGKPINHNALEQDHLKADAKKAGIPNIKYHELRHTFCSLAFAAGVDSALVQYYMGHKKPDMTAGIYRHLLEEQRRKGAGFAEKMAKIISPIPQYIA